MKIALLSDIHGNIYALNAVLEEAKSQNIETLLIAGDFVGYYYNPMEVLDSLGSFQVTACQGNHEHLLKKWIKGGNSTRKILKDKYGSGLEIASQKLSSQKIDWLFSLPHPAYYTHKKKQFCISHGTPWNIDTYLFRDKVEEHYDYFKEFCKNQDVIIMGHTHYQFMFKIKEFLIINPGSVGQPRSGSFNENNLCNDKARAEWAIIDANSLEVELKTTFYDPTVLLREISKTNSEHMYLKNVLYRSL